MSQLIFRSQRGPYSVWTCECCDGSVKIFDYQEERLNKNEQKSFYIVGHHSETCDPNKIGFRYESLEDDYNDWDDEEKTNPIINVDLVDF